MAEEQQGGYPQPRAGSWYSEKGLRPEIGRVLDDLKPKRGKKSRGFTGSPHEPLFYQATMTGSNKFYVILHKS